MSEKSCQNCACENVCSLRADAIRAHEWGELTMLHAHPLLPVVGQGDGTDLLVDRVNKVRGRLIIAASAIIGSACQHYQRREEA